MRSRNIILSFFSVLTALVFLAGTSGITLIIHDCPSCQDHSVRAGILLSPSEPEDHCCEAADMHCTSGQETSLESTCCHFKIEKLRIAGYAPVLPLLISVPADIYITSDLFNNLTDCQNAPLPRDLHNKHGGRHLLTFNCQFIS